MRKCTSCGEEIPENALKCEHCGQIFQKVTKTNHSWAYGCLTVFVLLLMLFWGARCYDHIITSNVQDMETSNYDSFVPESKPEPTKTQELIYEASGDRATSKFTLYEGLARFSFEHTGDENFIVWLLGSAGNELELLANEIGNYNGTKAINIPFDVDCILNIEADGNWKIIVNQ